MEMEHFHANAHRCLEYLLKCDGIRKKTIQKCMAKQVWSPSDRTALLSSISEMIWTAKRNECVKICKAFGPMAVDLLFRCSSCMVTDNMDLDDFEKHERICVVLGWLCHLALPNFEDFCMYYLSKFGAPFKRLSWIKEGNESRQPKRAKVSATSFDSILEATWKLMDKYPVIQQWNWQWSDVVDCLKEDFQVTDTGKCFLRKIVASISLRLDRNSVETMDNVEVELSCQSATFNDDLGNCKSVQVTTCDKVSSHSNHAFVSSDLSSFHVPVCGVLLQKAHFDTKQGLETSQKLVMTAQCKSSLQKLALSISDRNAVLLQGPTGCGKTALVEYVAARTGHSRPPYLTKIQLSDDTDSKTLTGTYVCTAVPGEFVWQPGLLIEACQKGYWILLEDVDRAPMDIISLLLPLIECRQLNIPGRSAESQHVSSQFRLFMTRRTNNMTNMRSLGTDMLSKLATTLCLDPIPNCDMKEIVLAHYPNLTPICEKLLKVYEEAQGQKVSSTQRTPSTRDLLKWCHRISEHTSVSGMSNIGSFVAQSAIDCFAASLADCNARLTMAETICSELNISADKAEYYCNTYKPTIISEPSSFSVGRAHLARRKSDKLADMSAKKQPFAETRHSCVILERVACCVETNEPVLLVGETGVGKTSALQYLAEKTGRKLHVVNMSQQSSSSDLLGGYKPAQISHFVTPCVEAFEQLFRKTFSVHQNKRFLSHIHNCMHHKRYTDLVELMTHSSKAAIKKLKVADESCELLSDWRNCSNDIHDLKVKLKSDSPIAFTFVEGKLSKCIQEGDWILLDEINLAAPDTLECLSSVLESVVGSIMLMERGDAKPITRHSDFRLFAAMNPATDVGKRNLPDGVRNRFTEFFVDEPENLSDLSIIVGYYLKNRSAAGSGVVDGIVKFYQDVRKLAKDKLVDGSGHKPHYSLRTLCRALQYVSDNTDMSLHKALYEGFHLAFLTTLNSSSQPTVETLIVKCIVGTKNYKLVKNQTCPKPSIPSMCVGNFHVAQGPLLPADDPHYILTTSVNRNLQDLARPVSYGKYPILIQGETSTGKTSLIKYLGMLTGNKVVRINNHEHTDLQEYVGSYSSNVDGKLVFQDGPLVTAMRKGHWVILDELNLAPTDILEALNRVLDDNREIFITETQEVVRAHPRFQLFATQNPPGLYGGRKILSRAFRNRFIELHFDEIPSDELVTILHKRCQLSLKHCKKLVKIMVELQSRRRSSGLFAGKHGYITLRDLFKWAERYRRYDVGCDKFLDWDQYLANDGFLLLAGRVRKKDEEEVIAEVITKHLGRSINKDELFKLDETTAAMCSTQPEFSHVVWTEPMRRLYVTLERALRFDEPVLLVGETGGGKTTACQMISALLKKNLAIVNCHANTEAADFIGGLRPVRNYTEDKEKSKSGKLFDWVDGPLVQSMNDGSHLLVDEISLADDSVLERLNSVLEPERCLVIPDKQSMDSEGKDGSFVAAKPGFQFLATMNPGGDFGKKELSPALRSRMTEVWCDVLHDKVDLVKIVQHNLHLPCPAMDAPNYRELFAMQIVDFVTWFKSTVFGKRFVVSVRDLLTWSNFMSLSHENSNVPTSYIHGACLVYIDGLGSGLSGGFASRSKEAHIECLKYIVAQLEHCNQLQSVTSETLSWLRSEVNGSDAQLYETKSDVDGFGVGPFQIMKGSREVPSDLHFTFRAPTTSQNAMRVLRALQLSRPILLEGSPGGGKTSLVTAIASASGHHIVRINLSAQTDASDLFGEDLPVENGVGGEFSWRDGPLLSALKSGHWVVLDELNLASQSVLESLNSVFDHRGEVYVPDLGQTFSVQRDKTRIFACQNPLHEGGGRKGLPKSFLNRFTQVHVRNLSDSDLAFILGNKFPEVSRDTIDKMVHFNSLVHQQIVVERSWAHIGSPWEFNLRDMTCWCSLVASDISKGLAENPAKHVYLIYCERLRAHHDREKMQGLFFQVFGCKAYEPSGNFYITNKFVQFGNVLMERSPVFSNVTTPQYNILPSMLHAAESLASVMNQNWPCILSGPSRSGKSRLVKMLATLSGNNLRILSTNSAMDAVELLGGYEQADKLKSIASLLHQAKRHVMLSCDIATTGEATDYTQFQKTAKIADDLTSCITMLADARTEENTEKTLVHLYRCLSDTLTVLKQQEFAEMTLPNELLEKCLTLLTDVQHKGTYEWVDSVLVEALRNGDWLLVDDANFCLPSVLDRLNALLEPNGVLSITERGMIDGKVVEIKPHKSFRLILVLDPAHGELSRAMRNRCIEIHLLAEEANCSKNSVVPAEIESVINSQACDSAESRFCQVMTSSLMISDTESQSVSDNAKLMLKTKEILSMHRMGINDIQPSMEHFGAWVNVPTVKEFASNPALSMVTRQLKIIELLPQLTRASDASLNTIICCCLQTLANHATFTSWKLMSRIINDILHSFLQSFADCTTQKLDYAGVFQSVLAEIFANEALQMDEAHHDMAWDPLTNSQLVEKCVDKAKCYSTFLKIVHSFLRYEEEVCAATFSIKATPTPRSKKRKRKLMNLTYFSASKSMHDQTIQLSDLPHPALVYLYDLYLQWNSLLGQLHVLPVVIRDATTTVFCQRKLMELSYIWRYFMESTFSLPAFTLHFSHLQSTLIAIAGAFTYTTIDPFSDVLALVGNISTALQSADRNKEKFSNKLKCQLCPAKPFASENDFRMHGYSQKLTEVLLKCCKTVFEHQLPTCNSWKQMVDLIASLTCHYSEIDFIKFSDFTAAVENLTDCNEILDRFVQNFNLEVSSTACTFGVTQLDRQEWPVQEYVQVSQMCSEFKKSLHPLLPICSYRLQPYTLGHNFQIQPSSVEMCILNTVNNFQFPLKGEENLSETVLGSENFFTPALTSMFLPMLAVEGSVHCQNLALPCSPNLLLGQSIRPTTVPLKHFDDKLKQLTHLQYELWSAASGMAGVAYPALSIGALLHYSMVSIFEKVHIFVKSISVNKYAATLRCHEQFVSACQKLSSESRNFLQNALCTEERLEQVLRKISVFESEAKLFVDVPSWMKTIADHFCDVVNAAVHILHLLSQRSGAECDSYQQMGECLTYPQIEAELVGHVGAAWVHYGFLLLHIVSPVSNIDPVKKFETKFECLTDVHNRLKADVFVWENFHCMMTNKSLTETEAGVMKICEGLKDLVHPRIEAAVHQMNSLVSKLDDIGKKRAYRPSEDKFQQLHSVCSSFVSSLGSYASKHRVLNSITEQNTLGTHNAAVTKLKESMRSFCTKFVDGYPEYPDITHPVFDAVNQILFGLGMVGGSSTILKVQTSFIQNSGLCVESFISDLLQRNSNDLHSKIVSEAYQLKNHHANLDIEIIDSFKTLPVKVLIMLLMDLYYQPYKNNTITRENLSVVLKHVYGMWTQHQEAKEQSEKERSSLYKYKPQVHEDDTLDEDTEIQAMFPSFEEDELLAEKSEATFAQDQLTADESPLLNQLFQLVPLVHKHVVSDCDSFSSKPKDGTIEDYSMPMLCGHHVAAGVVSDMFSYMLGNQTDHLMCRYNITLASTLQNSFKTEHAFKVEKLNVYKDPLPTETRRCLPVLQDFKTTVTNTLLSSYPDHPVLNDIIVVIRRILSFSVNSPIMKFVQGLELLLEKAQEWECNASRELTVCSHLEAITNLILDWRKLELKSWNRLLDDAANSAAEDSTKWWFFLYGLVQEHLKNKDSNVILEVVTSIQQFIESSSIVQFKERIFLLQTFCQDLQYNGYSDSDLATCCYNMHRYYQQFLTSADDRITSLRKPIEKQLKNFVKIAKWNDINFYAVKESIAKTHRTLFKFVKKFKMLLGEPVSLNVLKSHPISFSSTQDHDSKGLQVCKKLSLLESPQIQLSPTFTDAHNVLGQSHWRLSKDKNTEIWARIPTVVGKLHKHSSSVRSKATSWYPNFLVDVENTTGEIIENFVTLRKLEPKTAQSKDEDEKKKRLSEAKHIQSRKRKALSDLFKLLRTLGLSYRKGMVWKKSLAHAEIMLTKSIASKVLQDNKKNIDFNASADEYFYKLVSRWSAMLAALRSPNKEVGLSNIQRISGYTDHLMMIATKQRATLSELDKMHKSLCDFQQSLVRSSATEDFVHPDQQHVLTALKKCHQTAGVWLDSINKFKLILKSCPENLDEDFVTASQTKACLKNDSVWNDVMEVLDREVVQTSKIHKTLSEELQKLCVPTENGLNLRDGVFVSNSLCMLVNDRIAGLEKSSLDVYERLSTAFNSSHKQTTTLDPVCHSPLLVDIVHGRQAVVQTFNEISANKLSQGPTDCAKIGQTQVMEEALDLIRSILLSVQNLTKSLADLNLASDDGTTADGLLVKLVVDQLETDASCLKCNKIHEKLLLFVNAIRNRTIAEDDKLMMDSVLRLVEPFTTEYKALLEQTVNTTLTAHRTTTKMAYILSVIFSEVLTKGFCPPADVEEELSGDKGELKEVEDAGIGEGQGAKDMSDQIEEEDQVEDTPGGESKEENRDEEDDIPAEDNAIEMSEDFDGKLHDPEPGENDDDDDEKSEDDNDEELDKQMGELGDEADADKLDERMWGSDDEDNDEEEENKETKEEKGSGMDAGQSEMAAKDDEIGDDQGEKKEESKEEQESLEEQKLGDQSEFDPNERDDYHEEEAKDAPEDMEIPENLNLDENDDEQGEEENQHGEEENNVGMETEETKLDDGAEDDSEQETNTDQPEEMETQEDTEENGNDDKLKEDLSEENPEIQEENDEGETEEQTSNVQDGSEMEAEENDKNKEEDQNGEDSTQAQGKEQPSEESETPEETETIKDKISRKQPTTTEDNVQQSANATEQVPQQNKEEGNDDETAGAAPSSEQNSESASDMVAQNASNVERTDQSLESDRNMGKSDSKRSLADTREPQMKRLRTTASADEKHSSSNVEKIEADLYTHIEDDTNGYNQQTLDAATEQQIDEQKPENNQENDDVDQTESKETDDDPIVNNFQDTTAMQDADDMTQDKNVPSQDNTFLPEPQKLPDTENGDVELETTDPEESEMVQRDLALSSIHTNLENWTPCEQFNTFSPEEIQEARREMESQLREAETSDNALQETERLWQQYLSLTQPLSQQLSEQLRLILEPTQAAKLKGDYRSGRRLNMRKVIPYIASGFRKDKIWLRRSKPSKRAYQVMLAMDDSSSMADNHTKQLAFESLAVISSALSTLEAGQLAVCSFGELTRLLHDFSQPFTDQSGSSILQKCTFKQEQTKIAKLLEENARFMKCAQQNYTSAADPRVSQLLLIISDGRGLYIEGREKVESALRAAKDHGIFIAFVILDNPNMKDSILDIKVPIFKQPGQMPEIRSYMEDFPFPFYVVIRDVNALPDTLSEALRQWFELVTGST